MAGEEHAKPVYALGSLLTGFPGHPKSPNEGNLHYKVLEPDTSSSSQGLAQDPCLLPEEKWL